MKFAYGLLTAMALVTASPVSAQVVDLSTIKCQEFLGSGQENISYIVMWLHGYYAGKADQSAVIDFAAFTKDAESLGKYCGENPSLGLITASQKVLSKD